jgi:steroid 5-alpha reductase family enzyme
MTIPLFVAFSVYGLIVLVLVTSIFIVAQLRADNSIMDIAYGPTFLLAGLASAWLLQSYSPLTLLCLTGIALWSLRLGLRIYRKNKGQPEDARYAAWRSAWSARGQLYFILRSYLQINVLQGLIITLVSLPLILSLTRPEYLFTTLPTLAWSIPLGALIFCIGLTLESIADHQLDTFIARKRAGTEPAILLTTGLFRYSRRPNYFGETLIWWGLAIMVCPLPLGWLAFIAPLLITYIVTYITGPMLEALFLKRNPVEYRAYQERTSYFIPLPPKT